MSHHSDNHSSTEIKPVAFSLPIILGLVTVFIILLLVSTCDPHKHGTHDNSHSKEDASHHEHHATEASQVEEHH